MAAKKVGRSVSQEIQSRLEHSFLQEAAERREQQSIEEAFGGAARYQFLRLISAAADRIEWSMGKRVDHDPNAWVAFQEATARLFEEFAPPRLRVGLLTGAAIHEAKALGRDIADLTIANNKIAIYRQELKKAGVDPNSIDLTESR